MTTPLVTVANSIIEFILSLLRDPAAAHELQQDPEGALAKAKLSGVCADDIRAVAPVIYDRDDVAPRPAPSTNPTPHNHPPADNDVVAEITRITNSWMMIDNRATIVDQSVNQNIWTEGGDVSQIFDQSAGVASGDGSVAAGDDISGIEPPGPDDEGDDGASVVSPDGLDELDELAEGADGPDESAEPDAGTPPDDAAIEDDSLGAQLAEAEGAEVPPEVVDTIEDVVGAASAATPTEVPAPAPEPTPEPAYDAGPTEVEEDVWAEEPPAPVEEVVYQDDLGEEQ